MTNRSGLKYLRKVRRLLPCSKSMKKEITAPLALSLSSYFEEEPNANLTDITARFGTPEAVAASCLENTDMPVILRQLRIRKRVFQIVTATALTILLTWGGFLVYAYIDLQNTVNSYAVLSEIEIVEHKVIE